MREAARAMRYGARALGMVCVVPVVLCGVMAMLVSIIGVVRPLVTSNAMVIVVFVVVLVQVRRAGARVVVMVAVPTLMVVVVVLDSMVLVLMALVMIGRLVLFVGAGSQLGFTMVMVAERLVQRDVQSWSDLDSSQPDHRRDDRERWVAEEGRQSVAAVGRAAHWTRVESRPAGEASQWASLPVRGGQRNGSLWARTRIRPLGPIFRSNHGGTSAVSASLMSRAKLGRAVGSPLWISIWLVLGAVMTVPGVASASAPTGDETEVEDVEDGSDVVADAEVEEDAEDSDTRVVTVRTSTGDGLTATSQKIGATTIRTTPKRSAEDLLRLVPGMLVVQHGNQGKGHQYYIRGFDAVHGADVEVLVDDVPINERSNVHANGYLDLSFVIPEVVQNLEVKKGSVRLEQGAFGTAGSVEYSLGVPSAFRGTTMGYEFGSTGRHRAVVVHAPKDRGEETFVAATAFTDQGYGENREAQGLSTLGKARLWQGRGAYVDALGGLYAARFGLPGTLRLDDVNSGRVGFYDAYLHDTGGESSRALAAVRTGIERERGALSFTAHAQARRLSLDENFTGWLGTESDFAELDPRSEHGDRNVQHEEAAIGGVRVHGRLRVHDDVTLRLEGHWTATVVDQQIDQLTGTGAVWDVSRDQLVEQHELGIGPGLRWRALPWLNLEAGARVEAVHARVRDRQQQQVFSGTQVAAVPRFSAQALLGPRWQLFAAYGRGFRPPEGRAFTLPEQVPENVDLDEYAGGQPRMTLTDNAEVGARWQPAEFIDVGAAVFGTWIGRESVFDHVSGFNVELGPTQRLGVEADVQLRPTPWLGLGVSAVGNHARFTHTGAPIPGAPPFLAQVQGTLMHPKGWRAGVRGFVMGRRPLSYGATAGALAVLDASAGYQWRWLGIDLSVDNVLGSQWRDGEYHFASYWDRNERASRIPTIHYVAGPPRMFRISGSVRF